MVRLRYHSPDHENTLLAENTKNMFRKLFSSALVITMSVSAQAEDRALLIGVGEYAKYPSNINLPGIDLDINMMKQAAGLMGFDSIKTLLNEQATLHNVTRTMNNYLVEGVNANDRVLIYYSGHGVNIPDENGDEVDGTDEVLSMNDMQPATINGKKSLTGVLIDDQFNAILNKIPSDNILVLVDACNSGTSTRSISSSILGNNLKTQAKSFKYSDMLSSKGDFMPPKNKIIDKYVAISAAGDDEESIATTKGSLFTLGVLETIRQAAKNNLSLSPNDLKHGATEFIQAENKNNSPFSPRLSGNLTLSKKTMKIRANNDGYGTVWKNLVALTKQADPLIVSINQADYKDGDNLEIKINNNQSGYLNVINIGPKDEPTILFPNQYNPNAWVNGSMTIPTPKMNFKLMAQEPYGQSLFVAFLSSRPLNLYNDGNAYRNRQGKINTLFHSLSELGIKNIRGNFGVTTTINHWIKSGKVITRVCPSNCN